MNKTVSKNILNLNSIRSGEQLAAALKRFRKLQGYSQVELAKKSGLTQATISRVESSIKKVEIGTLFLILAALGADLSIYSRPKGETKISTEGLY